MPNSTIKDSIIGEYTTLEKNVSVTGYSCIGPDCQIGENCTLVGARMLPISYINETESVYKNLVTGRHDLY